MSDARKSNEKHQSKIYGAIKGKVDIKKRSSDENKTKISQANQISCKLYQEFSCEKN
jgi:hypothetical protein